MFQCISLKPTKRWMSLWLAERSRPWGTSTQLMRDDPSTLLSQCWILHPHPKSGLTGFLMYQSHCAALTLSAVSWCPSEQNWTAHVLQSQCFCWSSSDWVKSVSPNILCSLLIRREDNRSVRGPQRSRCRPEEGGADEGTLEKGCRTWRQPQS